jgi:hypothetical protein
LVLADIKVKREKAYGRWYMWYPGTAAEGHVKWSAGLEDEVYEKVKAEWLISRLKVTSIFGNPFEEG